MGKLNAITIICCISLSIITTGAVSAQFLTADIPPNVIHSNYSMAVLEQEQGNYESAIRHMQGAIAEDPFQARLYKELGDLYLFAHRVDDAISAYQFSINLDDTQSESYYLLGTIYIRYNDFENAVSAYLFALQNDPQNPDIMIALANCYSLMQRHHQALFFVSNALLLDPDNIQGIYQITHDLFALHYYDRAYPYIQVLVSRFPENEHLRIMYTEILFTLGQYRQCAEQAEHFITLFPHSSSTPDMYALQLQGYYAANLTNLFLPAITAAHTALPALPKIFTALSESYTKNTPFPLTSLSAYSNDLKYAYISKYALYKHYRALNQTNKKNQLAYDLAVYCMKQNNYSEALTYLQEYTNQGLKDPTILLLLSRIHESLHNLAYAETYLIRLSEIEPTPENFTTLGLFYKSHNHNNKAIRAYENATTIDAAYMPAALPLLTLYYHNKEYNKAITMLRQIPSSNTSSPEHHYLLALCYEANGDLQKAQKEIKTIVDHDDSNSAALYILATLYYKESKTNATIPLLQKAIQIDPDFSPALNMLGYLYAERGDNLDTALHYITHALIQEPNNYTYLDSLGWVYLKLGKMIKAQYFLERAVTVMQEAGASEWELYNHLGDVYERTEQYESAIEVWQHAIDNNAPASVVKTKMNRLLQQHTLPDQ